MKRDARIGLAIILLLGLAVTFMVARTVETQAPEQVLAEVKTARQDVKPWETLDEIPSLEDNFVAPIENQDPRGIRDWLADHQSPPGPRGQFPRDLPGTGIRRPPITVGIGPEVTEVTGLPPAGDGSTNNEFVGNQDLRDPQNQGVGEGSQAFPGLPPLTGNFLTPVVPPAAPTPVNRSYTVIAGDSPWAIAAKMYGNGKYADKILSANQGLDAMRLKVGQKLIIPPLKKLTSDSPAPRTALNSDSDSDLRSPRQVTSNMVSPVVNPSESSPAINRVPQIASEDGFYTYVIKPGDTLGRIAKSYYGYSGPKSVLRIEEANPGVDAVSLQVGETLKIPARDQVAQAGPFGSE